MRQESHSEEFRDAILQMMRVQGVDELPFKDVFERLREAYTNPITKRSPVRADNLRNAVMAKKSPFDLRNQGQTVVLVDYADLIK